MIPAKPLKSKACKVCKEKFQPRRSFENWCSPEHGLILALEKREKAQKAAKVVEKRADRVKREKLKSRADWAKEAQDAVNLFIRLRDAALPCISCGRFHEGQYHAGHFLSRGARPELRFDELNIHKQCSACNLHLSGNVVLYRKALIEKIGLESVDWLEGPHQPKNYTIDDLKAIKQLYTAKARELKEKM